MKPFVTSTVLHTLLLTAGLWSFGQPRTLDMTQGEALPVSIVPIEEFSQSVMGEREAEMTEAPAPEPTRTPETLPMPAENVGDNEVDLASPPRPITAPRERVQTATAEAPPPPPPPPAPEPEPEPQPEPEPVVEPEPAPEPEPEPVIDEAAPQVAEAPPEPEPQPQNVPRPQTRPTPPPQRTAEAPRETPPPQPERQQPTPPREQQVTESRSEREPEFNADEIAQLLNREQSAGGGAQRSEQQASLGGTRTTGARLSQSELDALRGQIARCWNPPAVADAASLRVSIQMSLDPSGSLQGMPQIVSGGGASTAERAAGEAALRAVRRCAPYNLPAEKYETWSQVQINFDPSEMF